MGGNIPGGNFLWENFLGESLMGGNFPRGNFPEGNFPRTGYFHLFQIYTCVLLMDIFNGPSLIQLKK